MRNLRLDVKCKIISLKMTQQFTTADGLFLNNDFNWKHLPADVMLGLILSI